MCFQIDYKAIADAHGLTVAALQKRMGRMIKTVDQAKAALKEQSGEKTGSKNQATNAKANDENDEEFATPMSTPTQLKSKPKLTSGDETPSKGTKRK